MLIRILFAVVLGFPLTLPAAAERGYITDKLEIPLRSGPGLRYKSIKLLAPGTPLTIRNRNPRADYSRIKLENGEEGWVLTRYLSTEPPVARQWSDESRPQLAQVLEENQKLKEELAGLRSGQKGEGAGSGPQTELERLKTELIAIRQASANAMQIQAERDRLQERVIALERELETTRREKSALTGDYRQNWFLIGAGVLFGGILLGVFLPKLDWRKRSYWDSF